MSRLSFFILCVCLTGCSLVEEQNAKIRTLEQKVTEMGKQVETLGQTNQELEKRMTEFSKDTSNTSTRVTQLEQKHASMEKMQLELIQYQDSLKSSLSRVRRLVDELKQRIDEGEVTEASTAKHASSEERQEKPVAKVKEDTKSSSKVEIGASPKSDADSKGFILEDFQGIEKGP